MNIQSPLSGLIFGSCVSRDLVRIDSDRFVAGHYTARQSWISAYADPRRVPYSILPSAFQQRMVEGDFQSTGRGILNSTRPTTYDVILLDLIDERLGVLPYEGSWITFSNELKNTRALPETLLEQLVPFGSDQHFDRWRSAAAQIRADLDPHLEKTYVLAARFASHTAEGEPLPYFRGEDSDVWNARYDRYYDELRSLGFNVAEHRQSLVVTNTNHKWGPTPFHYVDEAYVAFGDYILASMAAG